MNDDYDYEDDYPSIAKELYVYDEAVKAAQEVTDRLAPGEYNITGFVTSAQPREPKRVSTDSYLLSHLVHHACPTDVLELDHEWRLFRLDLHCVDALVLTSQGEVVEVRYVVPGYIWSLKSTGDYSQPEIVQGKLMKMCNECGGAW